MNQTFGHHARLIVDTCMAVAGGDRVAIVSDESREQEAAALAAGVVECGGRPTMVSNELQVAEILRDRAVFPDGPPQDVCDAIAASDQTIIVTDLAWPTWLWFGAYEVIMDAQARGARLAYLEEGFGFWDIDVQALEAVTNRTIDALELLRGASNIRVTSAGGTDIVVSVSGRKPLAVTPIKRGGEMLTPIPLWGEVTFAVNEYEADGRIVIDGSAFGIGLPEDRAGSPESRRTLRGLTTAQVDQPLSLIVREGRCVEVNGGADARQFAAVITTTDRADVLGEFAFGTSELSPDSSPGRLGTVHFSFGDDVYPYGGAVASCIHQNGIAKNATVEILDTGQTIVRDGRWVL